jgi:hypothetical protein
MRLTSAQFSDAPVSTSEVVHNPDKCRGCKAPYSAGREVGLCLKGEVARYRPSTDFVAVAFVRLNPTNSN